MKRKIFSTLLFGALAFVSLSTVTSCKDYDDDINNLQSQIDKAALKTDLDALTSQVSTVNTTATNALSTAEKALATANDAATKTALEEVKSIATKAGEDVAAAVKAAADAQSSADAAAAAAKKAQETADQAVKDAAAVKETAAANAKTLEQIGEWQKTVVTTNALKEQLDDLKEEILDATDEKINDLKKVVATYNGSINALYSAVTEVSLVGSFNADQWKADKFNIDAAIGTQTRNYTFGQEEVDDKGGKHSADPKKTYTEGKKFGFTDDILVRVSPVNATLTADMIKFVDSQGNDLSDAIEVTGVSKYTGLLTRASGNATGLWKISAKPKDGVTVNGLKNIVNAGEKYKLYAVAVNNTADQAENASNAAARYAVSTYDLSFEANAWSRNTDDNLHKVKVSSKSTTTRGIELGNAYTSSVIGSHPTTAVYSGTNQNVVVAKSGENVIVDFEPIEKQAEWFYVVRDDKHAGDDASDASEINAWNSYTYAGLNNVYAANGKKNISVTIPETAVAGDEIYFRVFAVAYNGNLIESGDVDASGNPIYSHQFVVYVADQNTSASVTGDLKVTSETEAETAILPLVGGFAGDGNTVVTTAGADVNTAIRLQVGNTSEYWTVTPTYYKDANGWNVAKKDNEAKYVKFELTLASGQKMYDLTDNATASKTVSYKEAGHGTVLNTFSVNLTKVLPTEADAKAKLGIQWKDKQLVNGVYTAYMYPTDGTKTEWNAVASHAYKTLTEAFNVNRNLGEDARAYLAIEKAALNENTHFYDNTLKVTAAAATDKTQPTGWNLPLKDESSPTGDAWVNAVNALIDNTTQHNAVFGYNYGKISSEKVYENPDATIDCGDTDIKISSEAFKLVFACPLAPSVQKFAFKEYVDNTDPENPVSYATNSLYYDAAAGTTSPANVDKLPSGHKSMSRYLVADNSFDKALFGGSWFGNDWATGNVFKKFVLDADSWVVLKSDGTGNVDYFNVAITSDGQLSFTQVSTTTNPTADVPSTLTLHLKDCFGHINEYTVPFTVLKR